jgi:hypothetical protein
VFELVFGLGLGLRLGSAKVEVLLIRINILQGVKTGLAPYKH